MNYSILISGRNGSSHCTQIVRKSIKIDQKYISVFFDQEQYVLTCLGFNQVGVKVSIVSILFNLLMQEEVIHIIWDQVNHKLPLELFYKSIMVLSFFYICKYQKV
jgi:hypothetical protein